MAGYWLKLYTEILDDPKYYRLSDNAKLGMYELMIVAKKTGAVGNLPSIDDISFYTRRTVEWWIPVIQELKSINFIVDGDSGNVIRKFEERQRAVDSSERQQQHRKALHEKEFTCNENVTNLSRNVTENRLKIKDTEVDTDTDTDNSDISPVQRLLEKVTGIPPSSAEDVKAMDDIAAMQPLEEDVRAAFDWLRSQGRRIYHYSSMVNPVRVSIEKRVHRPPTTLDKSKAAVMAVLEELEAADVNS